MIRSYSPQTPRSIYLLILAVFISLLLSACNKPPQDVTTLNTPFPTPEPVLDNRILYISKGEFFLTNLAGDRESKLFGSGRNNWFPVASPDNNYLAYWSTQSGFFELWVYDFQKQSSQQITFFNEKIISADYQNFNVHNAPSWTPDSRSLVFSRKGLIWSIGADGFNLETLIPTGVNYSPACSPDGQWLALVTETNQVRNLCLFERATGETISLTKFPATHRVGSPAWSPDSKQVLFTVSVFEKVDIWMVSEDGSQLNRLTNDGYSNAPAWSPIGNKIAFTSGRQDPYHWEIWAMNADGSGQFAITRNGGFSPCWYSPPKESAGQNTPVTRKILFTPVTTPTPFKPAIPVAKTQPALPRATTPTRQPTQVIALVKKKPTAVPTATVHPTEVKTSKPKPTATKTHPRAVEEFVEDAAPGVIADKDEYEKYEKYADDDKSVLPQNVQPEIKGNVIVFEPKLEFYFAKDMIKPVSMDALKQLATELNQYPDAPLVVRGYMRGPKFLKNVLPILKTLSRARANSVLRHLIVNEKIRHINVTAISENDLFPELGIPADKPVLLVEIK